MTILPQVTLTNANAAQTVLHAFLLMLYKESPYRLFWLCFFYNFYSFKTNLYFFFCQFTSRTHPWDVLKWPLIWRALFDQMSMLNTFYADPYFFVRTFYYLVSTFFNVHIDFIWCANYIIWWEKYEFCAHFMITLCAHLIIWCVPCVYFVRTSDQFSVYIISI